MYFMPVRKKIIAAFMIGAFAGGMAPIFGIEANAACISATSIAEAASCPTPTKRYQEAAKSDDAASSAEAKESVFDNIFNAAWRILLLAAIAFLPRIAWKHFQKKRTDKKEGNLWQRKRHSPSSTT